MGKTLLNLCDKFNNVFPIFLLSPPLGSGRREGSNNSIQSYYLIYLPFIHTLFFCTSKSYSITYYKDEPNPEYEP